MSPALNALLAAWVASEPIASSVMFIAAILLFWTSFARIWAETPVLYQRIWRVFRLVASIALFLGLAWGFYFFLKSNNSAFSAVLTKLIANTPALKAQQEASNRWGASFTQTELVVKHFAEVEYVEEFHQGKDETGKQKPILYLKRVREELIPQESLLDFAGDVQVDVVDPVLAKLEIQAHYRYTVANQSESPTVAQFSFPYITTRFYEDLSVYVDGKLTVWRIESGALRWELNMAPQQNSVVEINYRTRGTDKYQYSVNKQRDIRNFSLTVSVESIDEQKIFYSMSPTSKSVKLTKQAIDRGYRLNWLIDRVIIKPVITVQVGKPPAEVLSKVILNLLNYTGRALILLLSIVTLTLVLFNLRVDLVQLTLLTIVFVAQFLAVSAVYPFWGSYNFAMIIFGLGTVILSFLIFWRVESLPRNLIVVLVLIFAVMYPFAGLLPGDREKIALDGAIQAGIILYMFLLTFYVRIRPAKKVSADKLSL